MFPASWKLKLPANLYQPLPRTIRTLSKINRLFSNFEHQDSCIGLPVSGQRLPWDPIPLLRMPYLLIAMVHQHL